MERKIELYGDITKNQFKVEEAVGRLREAQKAYEEYLTNETIKNILDVQETDGKITKRDLDIFIGDLTTKVKQIYVK